MQAAIRINQNLAVFLAQVCLQAYEQFRNNGKFKIPAGFKLVKGFKAESMGAKEWFGFIIRSAGSIVIVFRGTGSLPDWISDVAMPQSPCNFIRDAGDTHRGFTSIYTSCRNEILEALNKLPPRLNLYVTGHSLGAALATLCALDVSQNTRFKKPIMYNFASPRVGSPEFVKKFDSAVGSSVRITNIHDIVPMLPPEKTAIPFSTKFLYYGHIRNEYPISIQGGSISKNHMLETYIEALGKHGK